ncbi:MAG: SRPBCC domain-containing protein [Gemmatimonadota bacterium]|nr:SRPBCC domain-containing protein [Gemmatimonadota bacterium]
MTDILHSLPINAPARAVFAGISTPSGLDEWWTADSAGIPQIGMEYQLTVAMDDWRGTRVRFDLEGAAGSTHLRFGHLGWPGVMAHLQSSSYCWAMYLRILKRYLEFGERVPYDRRLEV